MEGGWVEHVFRSIAGSNSIIQGLVGGIIITLFNAVGALVVLVWRNPSERFLNAALGFAAGVMLTASFTSLILPGIEFGGVWPVIIGMALGIVFLDLADHLAPHEHAVTGHEGLKSKKIRGVWLFIIAITLHNAPEGLAVGVGYGGGDMAG